MLSVLVYTVFHEHVADQFTSLPAIHIDLLTSKPTDSLSDCRWRALEVRVTTWCQIELCRIAKYHCIFALSLSKDLFFVPKHPAGC
jgi:hypothetical protein